MYTLIIPNFNLKVITDKYELVYQQKIKESRIALFYHYILAKMFNSLEPISKRTYDIHLEANHQIKKTNVDSRNYFVTVHSTDLRSILTSKNQNKIIKLLIKEKYLIHNKRYKAGEFSKSYKVSPQILIEGYKLYKLEDPTVIKNKKIRCL